MKKYRYSMTYEGPKTWHTCGPITPEHAKNQFKAFGVISAELRPELCRYLLVRRM